MPTRKPYEKPISGSEITKRNAVRGVASSRGGRSGSLNGSMNSRGVQSVATDYVQKVANVFKQQFADVKSHPPEKVAANGQSNSGVVCDNRGSVTRLPLSDVSQ